MHQQVRFSDYLPLWREGFTLFGYENLLRQGGGNAKKKVALHDDALLGQVNSTRDSFTQPTQAKPDSSLKEKGTVLALCQATVAARPLSTRQWWMFAARRCHAPVRVCQRRFSKRRVLKEYRLISLNLKNSGQKLQTRTTCK